MSTARHFFGRMATGIGTAALASLLNPNLLGAMVGEQKRYGGLAGIPHFPPKAKRVIYLFMAGGPSQIESLRPQARAGEAAQHRAARLHPHGAAHHGHDERPEELSVREDDLQVRPARQGGAHGSAS